MQPVAGSELQLIGGLVLAIAVLIVLVLKTKIHALLALVLAASIAGLTAGMLPSEVVASITKGFGGTLSTIGLVIGFGVMMGRILEVSGAAERMAYSLIRWLGRRREDWALVVTGYVVSIPIFCDSAFVILSPLVRALRRTTGKSVVTLGICLAAGLVLTHHAVPPTPGPLGVAGIYNVDIGLMIFWGLVLTLPSIAVTVWYARLMGPRIEAMIERDTGEPLADPFQEFEANVEERSKALPALGWSVAPIVLPILLIFANTLMNLIVKTSGDAALANSALVQAASFIGHPVIAVGLGVALAVYTLVPGRPRHDVLADLEKGVESAGIIILVTGAGGALGQVLRDSGAGQVIGQWVAGMPLPPVLIPFFIATAVRLVQGSGTVAMITGASISAPILVTIPGVEPVFAAQAAALGAMVCSYFNDSFFWVINRILGIKNAKHQLLTWTVPTTLLWFVSLVMILAMNALFG